MEPNKYEVGDVTVYIDNDSKESDLNINPKKIGQFPIETLVDKCIKGGLSNKGLEETLGEKDMVYGQIEYIQKLESNEDLTADSDFVKAYRPMEEGSIPTIDKALCALTKITKQLENKEKYMLPIAKNLKEDLKEEHNKSARINRLNDIKEIYTELQDMHETKAKIMSYLDSLFKCYDNMRKNT